ncbi:hypothetical protein ATO8_03711 [Roseivivax marinus]|uniref:Lipoprotein n=1 Tax=Roseivivax marinus TaxID=1379903 RepID=W4HPD5_9RHOB|nr:twin-arginine translocation signal domain-containing protein [Roseivivax marinus]ETW13966.1 hypothetical protein ATO8_03711 [Roseivivax marinus]
MDRRHFLAALGATALAAACAPIPSDTALTTAERRALRISNVQVVSSGANFLNSGAQDVRNVLAPDLQGVLRREFSDRIVQQGGWTMQVEVASLAVASATSTALGRDQSQLEGTVRLIDPQGTLQASVPIAVTAGEAAESVLGGAASAIAGSRSRFYRQLLGTFARDARTTILGRDLPGQRIVRQTQNAL